MQYEHTREQSAEFLRLAVGHMGRQPANFDPPCFTLWYEHAAGLNPALSQLLEEWLAKQRPITNADVSTLYAQHIGTRETQTIVKIQEKLLTLMRDTADAVAQSGIHAVNFGRSLESHTERLRQTNTLQVIEAVVNEMLAETNKMSAANLALARQLQSRAREVQSLTQRLEVAEADAIADPLTGLMNRRGLEQTVAARACAGTLKGCSLLLIDVDNLKKINDAHGHLVGDQVLRGLARVLQARIKGEDSAARLGGDEFAVFLPDTSLDGAVAVAEGIKRSLLQAHLRRIDSNEDLGSVCVSIGAAQSGEGGNLDSLMREADGALYEAKRQGRNQVRSAK